MKYFIFEQRWSQTDHDTVIVKASSKEEARSKIKGNARYVDYCGCADRIIE